MSTYSEELQKQFFLQQLLKMHPFYPHKNHLTCGDEFNHRSIYDVPNGKNKTETDRNVPGRATMFKVIVAQLSVTNIG